MHLHDGGVVHILWQPREGQCDMSLGEVLAEAGHLESRDDQVVVVVQAKGRDRVGQ